MDTLPPSIRVLARRLLAESHSGEPNTTDVAVISEKLRAELTRLTGVAGYSSLLRRAVTMARVEVPALSELRVTDDGRLDGMEKFAALPVSVQEQAAAAITAQILGLLVLFIGETLTQRIVRQLWPETSVGEQDKDRTQ